MNWVIIFTPQPRPLLEGRREKEVREKGEKIMAAEEIKVYSTPT